MLDRRLFVRNVEGLLKVHRCGLRGLCGKTLNATWLAWDEDTGTWLKDEAVIFSVGSDNLEIVFWKLDEVALTWNAIDVTTRPAWVTDWDRDRSLTWRRDALPALTNVVGKTITGVSVIEYRFQTVVLEDRKHIENAGTYHEAWLLHGLEFHLGEHRLQVFNNLDENGITDDPPTGPEFRRTEV